MYLGWVGGQSYPTLCDPIDCSLPGSSVHGIFQARIPEWVAISFSRGSSQPGIEPRSLALQVDALPSEPPGKPFMYLTWHRQWEPESMHGRQAAAGRETGCTACGPSWSTGAVHHGWGACQSHCLCVASISIYWELQHKNLLNLFWSCRIPSAPSIDKA